MDTEQHSANSRLTKRHKKIDAQQLQRGLDESPPSSPVPWHTTPPSLWSLTAAATIQSLQSALSELEPAAVASGWFQEGEIVDAIYSLDTDINRLALSRMFLSTHPYEDVHTLQNGHPTNVFTQEAFGRLMTNCVERLHSLQLVLFRTPLRTTE